MPACCSSRPVRRVSSQQTSAAVGERLDRPRRQVAEVADRRRDEDERGRRLTVVASSSRSSTTSPTCSPHRSNAPASASITHVRASAPATPTR